jgi:hypothetical protein
VDECKPLLEGFSDGFSVFFDVNHNEVQARQAGAA